MLYIYIYIYVHTSKPSAKKDGHIFSGFDHLNQIQHAPYYVDHIDNDLKLVIKMFDQITGIRNSIVLKIRFIHSRQEVPEEWVEFQT